MQNILAKQLLCQNNCKQIEQ